MNDSIKALVNVIKADPAVAHVIAYTGSNGGGGSNGGFIYVALKPLNERKVGVMEIIDQLAAQDEPAARGLGLPAGGAGSAHRRPRQQCALPVHHSGRQCSRPGSLGAHPAGQMKRLPGFQDVNSDQQNGGLEEYVTYDRVTAARLGLTPSALDSALYTPLARRKSPSSTPS